MMQSRRLALTVAGLACLLISISSAAIPAYVLTNTRDVLSGSLSGLGEMLRLNRPVDQPFVGPDMQFDVPIELIKQITFDFPRVIVETATRTLIAPFSAFAGISELLTLDTESGAVDL